MRTFARVMRWLYHTPRTTNAYVRVLCGFAAVTVSSTMFMIQVLALAGVNVEDVRAQPILLKDADFHRLDAETLQVLASICPEGKPIWSIIEESLFRAIPLTTVVAFMLWSGAKRRWVVCAGMFMGLCTAIIFGIAHGGWVHVPVQGMMGMCSALAFLKCGGVRGEYWSGLLAAAATHVAANELLLVIQYVWIIVAIR